MIFRICVWLSPPHAPMNTEIIEMVVVSKGSSSSWIW